MYKVYEVTFVILLSSMLMLLVLGCVYKDNGKTYIVDITGERWDVTQAKSIGFNPYHFHFGMGRNAFTPLDDSDWNENPKDVPPDLRIFGITDGDHSQAYSTSKLSIHEIANTSIASKPIAAGYWPLVGLAAVYSREIDGKTLTLVPSGWTYKSTFVLYDRETGSLWYPYEKGLMGIQGVYFERWLPKIQSDTARWKDWYEEHPDSKLIY